MKTKLLGVLLILILAIQVGNAYYAYHRYKEEHEARKVTIGQRCDFTHKVTAVLYVLREHGIITDTESFAMSYEACMEQLAKLNGKKYERKKSYARTTTIPSHKEQRDKALLRHQRVLGVRRR